MEISVIKNVGNFVTKQLVVSNLRENVLGVMDIILETIANKIVLEVV
jgi:hypothetical protein